MSDRTIYVFEVAGSGPFPVDMLRYDCCWPAREMEDSYNGLVPTYEEQVKRRTVRLCTINARPRRERWHSFGWAIVKEPRRWGNV